MNHDAQHANQPDRMPEHDAWTSNASLREWHAWASAGALDGATGSADTTAIGAGDLQEQLHQVGRAVGSHHLQDIADRANREAPRLATHDRTGRRIDEVELSPAWHELLGAMTGSGTCGLPWHGTPGGIVDRAAMFEMWARLDIGAGCPVSMTTAAVPVLLAHPDDDVDGWAQRLIHRGGPAAGRQPMAGMSMTEPQGGSDLADSSVTARRLGDGHFALDGHKWFCSYPIADVQLVLARDAEASGDGSRGLSCFLVPGWLDDDHLARNGFELLRLKDKLGTRSLPSAEVQLRAAIGTRIGPPGKGVRTIIDMVASTRLDCAVGSTGVVARAVDEAVHYASQRRAFGATLLEQPLMRSVLADLALERDAMRALAFETARATAVGDPVARIVSVLGKYWITRRAVQVCIEACECLGGNGYVEEWPLARLYRDVQVNSTWEGSGNVIVLDLFRALARDATLARSLTERIDELTSGGTAGAEVAAAIAPTVVALGDPAGWSAVTGRSVAGNLAVALQAALLAECADRTGRGDHAAMCRAFVATRITPQGERTFGACAGDELLAAADALLPARSAVS